MEGLFAGLGQLVAFGAILLFAGLGALLGASASKQHHALEGAVKGASAGAIAFFVIVGIWLHSTEKESDEVKENYRLFDEKQSKLCADPLRIQIFAKAVDVRSVRLNSANAPKTFYGQHAIRELGDAANWLTGSGGGRNGGYRNVIDIMASSSTSTETIVDDARYEVTFDRFTQPSPFDKRLVDAKPIDYGMKITIRDRANDKIMAERSDFFFRSAGNRGTCDTGEQKKYRDVSAASLAFIREVLAPLPAVKVTRVDISGLTNVAPSRIDAVAIPDAVFANEISAHKPVLPEDVLYRSMYVTSNELGAKEVKLDDLELVFMLENEDIAIPQKLGNSQPLLAVQQRKYGYLAAFGPNKLHSRPCVLLRQFTRRGALIQESCVAIPSELGDADGLTVTRIALPNGADRTIEVRMGARTFESSNMPYRIVTVRTKEPIVFVRQ